MMDNFLEARFDKALGKFVVRPLSKKAEDDFIIACNSEYDAKSLCAQITMQMIPSPIDNPLKYASGGTHPNGHTKVFLLK